LTKAASFRLTDVQRAIKAVRATGLRVYAVEVGPDGTVRILTSKASALSEEYEGRKDRELRLAFERLERENGVAEPTLPVGQGRRRRG
jgi:trans-aconitate methyltransferase